MTARLRALCALIEPSASFIDVGCDHGYAVEYVVKHKLADRITACDISMPSLEKAKKRLGENAGVTFVCADGATAAAGYATVLIAGMGGHEMLSVTEGCAPDTFVLSPQSHVELVRERLLQRDYSITHDCVVEDGGKFYDILQAKRGGGKEQLARAIPLQLNWGMFLQEKNEALLKKLRAKEAALASYPLTRQNESRSRQVKEAILWQLR